MNHAAHMSSKSSIGATWAISVLLIYSAFPGAAMAQESEGGSAGASDFSGWTCRLCPEPEGWEGTIDFGLGWITDSSLRYGNYRGLEDDGAYLPLDMTGRYRDSEGRYAEFSGDKLALDSRKLDFKGGRDGRYELRLGWNEIPTYRGYGAQTPFQGQGSDTLVLPNDWLYARSTSEMTNLQASLQSAPLKLQRKTLDAGVTFRISGNWSVDLDAQRQDKTGTRAFGGAGVFYNNASQIMAPVDFTTDRVDFGLNWGNRDVQLRLGFSGSWFDNGKTSLTWDNPFNDTPGVDVFRTALEPSNESYRFSLTGAWAIAPGIHVSGHASLGEMTQDEAFLPYSINPDFENLALPRSSLDGKVEASVFNAGGKFFARINSRLSITASAKYDERDNQTPIDLYRPVNSELFVFGERSNRPYGFERTQYSAKARFRAFRKLRLGGGVKYKEIDRTFQAIEESDETTWWGEAKFTPWSRSHIRLSYEQSSRDTSEYNPVAESGRVDHPLFRKFNQADRDRERGRVEAFYSTMGGLGLNLSVYAAEDEYDESVLGLQSSDVQGASFSADYAISAHSSAYAFASRDTIESDLFGRSDTLAWVGQTDDRIATFGAGFSTALDNEARVGVDFIWADSEGDIDVRGTGAAPFSTLETTLKNFRIHYSDKVNDRWGYRLYVEFESFDSSDWAIDGIGVDGVDAILTYGLISPRYDVWNFSAQATYRF